MQIAVEIDVLMFTASCRLTTLFNLFLIELVLESYTLSKYISFSFLLYDSTWQNIDSKRI